MKINNISFLIWSLPDVELLPERIAKIQKKFFRFKLSLKNAFSRTFFFFGSVNFTDLFEILANNLFLKPRYFPDISGTFQKLPFNTEIVSAFQTFSYRFLYLNAFLKTYRAFKKFFIFYFRKSWCILEINCSAFPKSKCIFEVPVHLGNSW